MSLPSLAIAHPTHVLLHGTNASSRGIRSHQSDGAADKMQAIFFFKRQARRFCGGELLQPRRGALQKHMVLILALHESVQTDGRRTAR